MSSNRNKVAQGESRLQEPGGQLGKTTNSTNEKAQRVEERVENGAEYMWS